MKLALVQINSVVGDLSGNTAKIISLIDEARREKADLAIFPELVITGYPPEDLLLKPQFVIDNLSALKKIAKSCRGMAIYLGFVDKVKNDLFNAGAFIVDGKIKQIYHKNHLPNYSVFDEKRYFTEGSKASIVNYKGYKIGLGICEDIWVEKGPYVEEAKKGAHLILNINASPYHVGKIKERQKMLSARAKKTGCCLAYVNMVGGQDELVFDGGSMLIDPKGKLIAACDQYREEMLMVDIEKDQQLEHRWLEEMAEIYEALKLGVKDYVGKNGFSEVLIGLSGGIDSALTAAVAADALGSSKVHAIFMPTEYSSEQSYHDARQVAENLKVEFVDLSIQSIFSEYLSKLVPNFKGRPADTTEENLQARIRGNILMALSNKFNWLVLTTGNKSEMSTGYSTLYGDMAGGFSVLKDIPKTLVYRLVDWINREQELIPRSIIERAPTAELKPGQTDQDTLPPYEVLDPIMQAYVEENKSLKQIVAEGFEETIVKKVIGLIDHSEYKRRQSPPGPRITPRAFGKDWRLPITNWYRNY